MVHASALEVAMPPAIANSVSMDRAVISAAGGGRLAAATSAQDMTSAESITMTPIST